MREVFIVQKEKDLFDKLITIHEMHVIMIQVPNPNCGIIHDDLI